MPMHVSKTRRDCETVHSGKTADILFCRLDFEYNFQEGMLEFVFLDI